MLKVCLFGVARAYYYDRPVPGFPNQYTGLVFAYLLLNRRYTLNREQLAAVFWGDYPSNSARKNFRSTLWRLRQSLQSAGAPPEDYLLVAEESITFNGLSRYWLDVEAFEAAALVRSAPGQPVSAEQADQLKAARDLYTGELLEGVYDDWCLYERERLRLVYLSVLNHLMVYHRAQGEYEQALEFGEQILLMDHTRETTHRELMALHWLAGNRAAALVQYKQCAQILQEEVGVKPMEETHQLYESMLKNRFTPEQAATPPAAALSEKENASMPTLVEYTLQQIHRLQKNIEETNAELYRIENLIYQALGSVLK